MSERVTLTWDMPNWITILLMVGIGMGLVAAVASLVRQNLPSSES